MKKQPSFLLRHLSTLMFIVLYIIIAGVLIGLESFVAETQAGLFQIMAVSILTGAILDYIISKNTLLPIGYKVFTQILPSGVFILLGLTFMMELVDRTPPIIFNYLIFLIIAAPFAIASFDKATHKYKLIFSLLGTALMFSVYLYLTTITIKLNKEDGLVLYILSAFLVLYAASSIPKLPFLSTILGLLAGIALYWIYKYPVTADAIRNGWDFDIAENFEYILLITIGVGILLTFLAALVKKPAVGTDGQGKINGRHR